MLTHTSSRNTFAPLTWLPALPQQVPQQTPQDVGLFFLYALQGPQAPPPSAYQLVPVAQQTRRVVPFFPPLPYLQ